MLKRICCIILTVIMVLGIAGCSITKNGLPKYDEHEFTIAGLWAPYELTEESLQTYKTAGFNTLPFSGRGEGEASSDNRYYLGSNRTKKALDLCKKVGLDAWVSYSYWAAQSIEGEDYYSENSPFSQHDVYSEYKDIIKAVRIWDEPNKEAMEMLSNSKLIEDFESVYPESYYVVNLIPEYAGGAYCNFTTYDELMEYYEDNILSKLENKIISVDCYPFPNEEHHEYPRRNDWLISYDIIAKVAKENNAKKAFIMQASTGLEFTSKLTEADMRLQANIALSFGADILEYYLYSVPLEDEVRYNNCILNRDNTPSELYYHIQKVNKEIQSFADAILSYDWDTTTVINATGIGYNSDIFTMMQNEFENPQYYESGIAVKDLVVSRFTSEKYGEAYMLVNYAPNDGGKNLATITFKNCEKIAIYGGKGFDGEPEIYELDEQGKFQREFEYGDGVFVVPLKK